MLEELVAQTHCLFYYLYKRQQDKIFRRKRPSTGANFVYVYMEIGDKGILKFNTFSMLQVKKKSNVSL